jgi:hypothetical protein
MQSKISRENKIMQIIFGETVIFNIFEKDRSLLSFLRKDDVSSSL